MTDYTAAVGGLFGAGGVVVLGLYAVIVWRPPETALDRDETWGYLGRHGNRGKALWAAGTTVTASSVLGLYAWIVFGGGGPATLLALAGTVTFMAGAITWPAGVLGGSMRVAQVGVAFAAAGAVTMLVYTVAETHRPAAAVAAAAVMAFHHVVVDGLWAVLTPRGAGLVAEALL